MKAKLKIFSIDLRPNNQKRQTDCQSDDFISLESIILKIQLGDCESSFDLKSLHFLKLKTDSQERTAFLNYKIKVKNFHKEGKVIISWQDKSYEIERNKNYITLDTDCLSFTFYYELFIDEIDVNDETSTKKASILIENKEKKYQKQSTPNENKEENYQKPYIPIKKQQIHSFLEDNDIENILPKVDF